MAMESCTATSACKHRVRIFKCLCQCQKLAVLMGKSLKNEQVGDK